MTESNEENAKLRVGAHVLIQLGRELVTDPEQALLELVKNAYDADSPRCEITVDTHVEGHFEQVGIRTRLEPFIESTTTVEADLTVIRVDKNNDRKNDLVKRRLSYTGRITVRDRGVGMSPSSVKNSWLVVSNSVKRVSHGAPKDPTKLGRTPLGDKGLGRLGTMRLGDILCLRSSQEGSNLISEAWFRWKDCEGAETLDRIPVEARTYPNDESFVGTEVTICGLNEISEWRNSARARELSYSIASIVSPFEAIDTFPVSVRIDGLGYDLEKVSSDLLKEAASSFEFKYNVDENGDGILSATARFRRSVFTASNKIEAAERAKRILEKDKGESFLAWLCGGPGPNGEKGYLKLKKYDSVKFSLSADWMIEITESIPFSKIIKGIKSQIGNPGTFKGAFYYFNFNRISRAASLESLNRVRFNRIKGIAILRDGFRVRAGDDWLNLARSMTSGSTYHLRVDNTAGYFALSGAENYLLTEKSDREGFVDDAYYRGFFAIAEQCRNFANRTQEEIRRGLDEYAKLTERRDANVGDMTTSGAMNTIKGSAKTLAAAANTVSTIVDTQRLKLNELRQLKNNVPTEEQAAHALELAQQSFHSFKKLSQDFDSMRSLAAAATVVAQQLELRSDQVAALVESAAVGLAARGLTHEIRTHLFEIERNTHAVREIIRKTDLVGLVSPHLHRIDIARRSLTGTASQIDPMLPRSRAIKERLSLTAFIREYFQNRAAEIEREGIVPVVIEEESSMVAMNRSRLTQVLENLVSNSRYWLRDEGSPPFGNRQITVVVDKRGFIIWDNGPGVDQKVEDTLFELFVTEKPAVGSGQGLGLFIVTQLLGLDGCSIELLSERNKNGRRYQFRIDLSKVVVREEN